MGYRQGCQNNEGLQLAAEIEELAERRGFTIRRILLEASVNWSQFSRWRLGETNPYNLTLERVRAAITRLDV